MHACMHAYIHTCIQKTNIHTCVDVHIYTYIVIVYTYTDLEGLQWDTAIKSGFRATTLG